ncbi:MAG: response regulator transcription factor [Chitinophagales bacterium]
MKLLVIEDEKDLSDSICSYLGKEQFICETAYDYRMAMEKIHMNEYACIILDIMLPFGSGMDLLKKVREEGKTDGILIISAKNSLEDKVQGLQIGADDYLPKPFHLPELAARVNAIIRRNILGGNNIVSFNEISIDTRAKQVTVKNDPVELTRKEYELMLYFISNQRRVISKNALVAHLWSQEMGTGENVDFIYTHIKNLRKKLQEKGCGDYIKSLYGMGYKLTDQ